MRLLSFAARLFATYHSGPVKPARITVLSTSGRTRKRRQGDGDESL